jgi:hypothetical protein
MQLANFTKNVDKKKVAIATRSEIRPSFCKLFGTNNGAPTFSQNPKGI